MTKLPQCFIWDIDCTISHKTNRTAYDYYKVGSDEVDKPMQMVYKALKLANPDTYFFFITGREDYCVKQTEHWLGTNGFQHQGLFMRATGDRQPSANLKLKLFREFIANKYEVIAVFEDEERCVKMYRELLGLKVLQPQDGPDKTR